MLAFFSSCVAVTSLQDTEAPQILSIEFSCDPSVDQWSMRLFASGWTDGGDLVMATESRIEIHGIDSIRAQSDGLQDELLMTLSIEANPDDAMSGRTSGFLCTEAIEEILSMRAGIFAYQSNKEETDCWEWGPVKDFSPWDYAPCDRVDPSES